MNIDTTVQEKNITFPTDTKLRMKIIAKCWKIAQKENLVLRRSYKREDKNKIHSLHEPQITCIVKRKAHKKFEFGSKAVIAMTKESCFIVGVKVAKITDMTAKRLQK